MTTTLREWELRALRLIDGGTRMRLTHRGNVIVSQHAKKLAALGLIREAPESWIAYEPTAAGHRLLAETEELYR